MPHDDFGVNDGLHVIKTEVNNSFRLVVNRAGGACTYINIIQYINNCVYTVMFTQRSNRIMTYFLEVRPSLIEA